MIKLKLLFVIPGMIGGPYWQPVFKYLTQHINDFLVITTQWRGFLTGYEDEFNIKIIKGGKYYPLKKKNKIGYYEQAITLLPISIIKELVKFKPQVIITSTFGMWTIFVLLYKIVFRKKAILFYEGSSPSVDFKHSKIRTLIRKIIGLAVDAYLTNTYSGELYLKDHLKIDPQKIFRYPIETPDREFFKINISNTADRNDKIKFISTGQIIKRKGIENLIWAIKKIRDEGECNFLVSIAGKGEMLTEYQKLVSSLSLDSYITFLGQLNYEDLQSFLNEGDVFVFPSLEETWGVAPLEALAVGKPLLLSQYVGSSELVENSKNGFIFNPNNIDEFSERIKWFLQNKKKLQSMSINALKTIEKYNAKSSADYIAEIVKKVHQI